MSTKQRIDQVLLERGLVPDLNKARALIMAGAVIVNEQRVDKAGDRIPIDAQIRLKRRHDHQYVGRGGIKLAHALDTFQIDPTDLICLDLGANVGGFTDCLLQRGARLVYAVDVGYGMLDLTLRQHPQVVCQDRKHAKDLTREDVPDMIDLLVADVSFISLLQILPPVLPLLTDRGQLALLVKPQFEAAARDVEAGGVVRDPDVRAAVCERLKVGVQNLGFEVHDLIESPITGHKGNVEFLLHAWRKPS